MKRSEAGRWLRAVPHVRALCRTTDGERTTLGRHRTLLRWRDLDPVEPFERRRHERIIELQGNRNRFIDDPMLARALFGMQCPAPSGRLVVEDVASGCLPEEAAAGRVAAAGVKCPARQCG